MALGEAILQGSRSAEASPEGVSAKDLQLNHFTPERMKFRILSYRAHELLLIHCPFNPDDHAVSCLAL
jgi:hypothetical protein